MIEVELLLRELSESGGIGSGLSRSDSGDLGTGEVGPVADEVILVSGIAEGGCGGLMGFP